MKGVSVEIHLIRSEADYKVLLAEVSALIELDPDADSPEGERLEKLGLLVEEYEARHYPLMCSHHQDHQIAHVAKRDECGSRTAYIYLPNRGLSSPRQTNL